MNGRRSEQEGAGSDPGELFSHLLTRGTNHFIPFFFFEKFWLSFGEAVQSVAHTFLLLRTVNSEASTRCFSKELAAKQDLHFLSSWVLRLHCHLASLGVVTSSLDLSHSVVRSCLMWSTCYYVRIY